MKKEIAQKKMKRGEIINLFASIREIKNGNLSKDALVKYVMLRVKLKAVFDEFEIARKEISEQTKPEEWKEGDNSREWDKAFAPVVQKWLDETIELDTHVLSEEECVELISSNPDASGVVGDVVMEWLRK